MRNYVISFCCAILLLAAGIFIINWQLWHSAVTNAQNAAQFSVQKIDRILSEATDAIATARRVADEGCSADGQFTLGSEAALRPHLKTVVIVKNDAVWCSSLPGNGILIRDPEALPDAPLLLLPGERVLDGFPVLVLQSRAGETDIIVSISVSHLRDVLINSLYQYDLAFVVGGQVLRDNGEIVPGLPTSRAQALVPSAHYAFALEYTRPSFWDSKRLMIQGWGLIILISLCALAVGTLLQRYLNKFTTMEQDLRRGIEQGEIVPFYQPVVNGQTGEIYGMEVLARWKHPQSGYISPLTFIPLAEKSGQIIPLTQSLMRQVADHLQPILAKLPEGFHVGINVSSSHVNDRCFIDDCESFCQQLAGGNLQLVVEVTEREPLFINPHLIENLNALHEKGVAIALDDFGTGYSGLSYLNDLSIDYIKIDKSFVSRVTGQEDSARLLDCVIDLARKLSLSIVAEGVETKEQLEYLNRKKITLLQGYYFWKPVSYVELVKILLSKRKAKIILD